MAETFRRVVGDQATLGYRQLPSIGSEGPDLKTLVYAGLGVALGILVGTVMADGSWRTLSPLTQHPIVQAGSSGSGSGSASPAATKATPTPPVQAQSTTHESPQSSVALQSPAIHASADSKAPVVHAASVPRNSTAASNVSVTHNASVNRSTAVTRNASSAGNALSTRKASGTRRVSAAHRRRPVHGLAGWRRHLGRHKALRRHRLRAPRRAAITAAPPVTDLALKPVDMDTGFIFTVEGELTVSAYNALAGTIETYEGEAFALHNAASANSGIHGEALSPNIHYKCDRFGSCTLIAGQFILDAQRTR
jgi:hypothetical protein